MSLKDFSVLDIDGSSYLVFDGKDKDHDFSYITGNIAPGLNLQVQTSGPGHEKAARDLSNRCAPASWQRNKTQK